MMNKLSIKLVLAIAVAGFAGCSDSMPDSDAISMAKNQYIDKEREALKRMAQEMGQSTAPSPNVKFGEATVISNDGVIASVQLEIKPRVYSAAAVVTGDAATKKVIVEVRNN